MTSNSITGFPRRLREALSDGKTEYAAKLFSLEKNAKEILNNSWDIIPVLTENLNIQIQNVNNEVFNCSKHLLNVLSEQSQPQEALLQLVTELEEAKDDVNFVALLDPVFNIILRILEKRGNSLAWCFNSIQGYLEKCEPPDYKNLNDKERLFVENNHNAKRIIRLYDEVLVFYNKIAKNFNSFDAEAQSVVQKFLIQLLGKPLCYLSMEKFGDIKTRARGYAETIVEMISGTLSDPIVFLEYKQDKFNDELIVPGSLGLANLFYLLYGEVVQIDNIPKVYHPVYIFQVCLHLLYVLLDQQNQISSEKGLKLGEFLLLQVKDTKLSYLLLGSKDHSLFCKALTDVIVYHPSKQVRTRALDLFKCYLLAFEVRATYLIIFNLLDTLTHSGLMGYIITIYKDLLNKALCSGKDDSLKYFKGPKLFRLLRKFCHLSENEETNLMENSDQIISALNLLRYLALRDSENLTEVWDFLPDVEDIFLQPLRKGIELSRAHYELKIKEFDDVKSAKTRGDDMEVSVRVNGEGLPQINKEDQLKVLNSSLTALDVMQSLLTRVTECVANTRTIWMKCKRNLAANQSGEDYEEDIRNKILEASLPFVLELGWSREALSRGAQCVGYPGITHGIFTRGGGDLVHYFNTTSNLRLLDILKELRHSHGERAITPGQFAETAIRERLKMIVPYVSRWPQAIAVMSLPPNVPNALATLLTMVDDVCYYAGDRSVDFNWYIRRVGVAGVYKATELYLIQDKSPDQIDTWDFLRRRMEDAVQLNAIISKSDIASQGAKDVAKSAFITARNILGLSWNR